LHDDNAPVAIGKRACEPGADGGAQKRAGHREAKQPGRRMGPVPYGVDRAIDDSGIEAEEESSHRGRGGDKHDLAVSNAMHR
jgi:hypothetical protein